MIEHPPTTEKPQPRRGFAGWLGRPLWMETRSPFELRRLQRGPMWRGQGIPQGQDRPALIVPGFMAGRHSASALCHVMNAAGWRARVAAVGRNAGPAYHGIEQAAHDLHQLVAETTDRVTIVGHSRGGQFGRVLAVRYPELIRQVIGVGTPFTVKYPSFVVVKLPAEVLDWAWRQGAFGHVDAAREQTVDDDRYLEFPDHIDLVSVWSRSDGIVDWRLSLEPAAANIEVRASHLGLINSEAGIRGIARALSRQD